MGGVGGGSRNGASESIRKERARNKICQSYKAIRLNPLQEKVARPASISSFLLFSNETTITTGYSFSIPFSLCVLKPVPPSHTSTSSSMPFVLISLAKTHAKKPSSFLASSSFWNPTRPSPSQSHPPPSDSLSLHQHASTTTKQPLPDLHHTIKNTLNPPLHRAISITLKVPSS